MTKRHLSIIFLTIVFFLPVSIFAQGNFRMWQGSFFDGFEVGIAGGVSQYRGEYQGFKEALGDFSYNFCYGANVGYNVNVDYGRNGFTNFFDKRLRLSFGLNIMKASSKEKNDVQIFSMDIMEANFEVEYSLLRFSSHVSLQDYHVYHWTPYIVLGVGYTFYKASNREMMINSSSYSSTPSLILGGGGKFSLFDGITFTGHFGLRLTNTDEMDYKVEGSTPKDMYYYAGLELRFNFSELFY